MDVCLMIEGQEDVTWEDWLALAAACEEHGGGTMFRSDHYLSVDDRRERGSLDAWGTITALGAVTEKLRLGTMVSAATFLHPAVLAKAAATAQHGPRSSEEVGQGAGHRRPRLRRPGGSRDRLRLVGGAARPLGVRAAAGRASDPRARRAAS